MISIAFVDFYDSFDISKNIFVYALGKIYGKVEVVDSRVYADADLVICSVFGNEYKNFTEKIKSKAIMWIGENQRPDYNRCLYSISCDFDSYYGYNFRLPLWMLEIDWFEQGLGVINKGDVEEILCERRQITRNEFEQRKFCITIFNNPEPCRVYLYEGLNEINTVEGYGRPFRNWFATDLTYKEKIEKLRGFRFNLCPENSYWPGYYTEKCLHAKVAGCIPITLSDPLINLDFNSKSLINLYQERSVKRTVECVKKLNLDYYSYKEIYSQPLLYTKPSINNFLECINYMIANILTNKNTRIPKYLTK